MDKPEEKQDAAAIEDALPGAAVSVEDVTLPSGEPVEVAVIEGAEPERPHHDTDMAYRLGRLETRQVECEKRVDAIAAQVAAFESATIAAMEAEAEAIAEQGEVVSDVAEEVLPPDHEAASTHNPDHGSKRPKFYEHLLAGSGRRRG